MVSDFIFYTIAILMTRMLTADVINVTLDLIKIRKYLTKNNVQIMFQLN